MSVKDVINDSLRRAFGLELRRVTRGRQYSPPSPAHGMALDQRIVESPIFIYSSIRSGSTLLRVMLNSHSQIVAPHELHLRHIKVNFASNGALKAVHEFGLRAGDLEHLLWDRFLASVLAESGKSYIVSKTPGDVQAWRRIARSWPEARYIFLLRHPGSIVASWAEAQPDDPLDDVIKRCREFMDPVNAARKKLVGHTVRYEDLTQDPEKVLRGVCDYLGVSFEDGMLRYGGKEHRGLRRGLGDWRGKIKSGVVQPPRPLPAPHEVPDGVRDLVEAWGYGGHDGAVAESARPSASA
jgi:sulfotransferase family protein